MVPLSSLLCTGSQERKIKISLFTPSHPTIFGWLRPHFSSKWIKHGLKWKLGSLSTKRVIEHIAMMYSFARRGRQSSLVWLWKFASFWYEKFENLPFFTYIGNMYIKWKLKTFWIQIWHKKIQFALKFFAKNGFFKIFVPALTKFFFLKLKFFENFYIQPPKFIFFTCFKHQKWKIHEGLTLLTSSQTKL